MLDVRIACVLSTTCNTSSLLSIQTIVFFKFNDRSASLNASNREAWGSMFAHEYHPNRCPFWVYCGRVLGSNGTNRLFQILLFLCKRYTFVQIDLVPRRIAGNGWGSWSMSLWSDRMQLPHSFVWTCLRHKQNTRSGEQQDYLCFDVLFMLCLFFVDSKALCNH